MPLPYSRDRAKRKLKQIESHSSVGTVPFNPFWTNLGVEAAAERVAVGFGFQKANFDNAWKIIDGKVENNDDTVTPIELKGEIFDDSKYRRRYGQAKWVPISTSQLRLLKRDGGEVWLVRFYKTGQWGQSTCRWSLHKLAPIDLTGD